MREIYSLIEEYKENNDCTIVTGINGDIAGAHGLIVNGKIVYENNIGKSLDSYLADILGISSCGIVDTDAGQFFVERLGMNARIIVCGAENHRFGLYDMVMLKDNHVDFCGNITKAVEQTKAYLATNKLDLKIEVETRNLEEVKEALAANVDFIMLDNFDLTTMKEAVQLIAGKVKTEASGGITKDSVKSIAETGVDFISSGAIIHSAPNFDLSLKAIK